MRIDWSTLALQTVNVLVLVWLLARFLFRPVMAIIAERRIAAEKLLADAAQRAHRRRLIRPRHGIAWKVSPPKRNTC